MRKISFSLRSSRCVLNKAEKNLKGEVAMRGKPEKKNAALVQCLVVWRSVAELEEEMRLTDAELQHQHDMAAAAAASAASNKASSSADN